MAGHPEGHPYPDEAAAFNGLQAWRDWARETKVRVDIVTQFCFESAPILKFLAEVNARGIKLPMTIGLAGPATPARLTKFALRCGIGCRYPTPPCSRDPGMSDPVGNFELVSKWTGLRHEPVFE